MRAYFFIQSRDPFSDNRVQYQMELAQQLSRNHKVTVLLVQNAVLAARKGAQCFTFDLQTQDGIAMYADEFSLTAREIRKNEVKDYIKLCDMNLVVDALVAKELVIWN